MSKRSWLASLLTTALLLSGFPAGAAPNDYRADIESWRLEREERLKADGGWLTVVGLEWLEEGDNRFGGAPSNQVVLPSSVPARAGVIRFRGGRADVEVEPGVEVLVDGKPVTSMELHADTSGAAEVLKLGSVWMHLIERQGRFGLRVKDMNSRRRREFTGLDWYPIEETYRIEARFVPHPQPETIPITNVLGQVEDYTSPGYAEFTLDGRLWRLHPVLNSPDSEELFFIFRDATSPGESYGAGRYLYAELPKHGAVVLDFNKAYSPPCAFTDFATCPLPPKQNRLPVRIEAGEKKPRDH